MKYLTKEGYEKCKSYVIDSGDILLSDVSDKTFVKIVPNNWNKIYTWWQCDKDVIM